MAKRDTIIYLILGIIIISIILIILSLKGNGDTPKALAKCIGENSELYVQLGCGACEVQEKMFGENYQYLNIIDCAYDRQECMNIGITRTPTWIIKGGKYEKVQAIDKLKELTGC